ERPDTFRQLGGDAVLNAPLFQENILGFAVPYGLALQTLGLSRIHTSLLPPEIATAREVRRKKPWAVVAAAALLSGMALSMIGNGITYSAVHSAPWEDAVKQATDLTGQVGTWNSAYEAAKSEFDSTLKQAESLVQGRQDMLWPEVYKAINETLPREVGDAQSDTTDIKLRNRVSLNSITNVHLADVGQWYSSLSDSQKETMSTKDRETGPQGEGYVFLLQGTHYHHEENNPQMQEILYVLNAFLKPGLQQWTVTAEDGSPQDVGRLGISHAMAEVVDFYQIPYDKRGPGAALASREGEQRVNVFSGGMGGFNPRGAAPLGGNRAGLGVGQGGPAGLGRPTARPPVSRGMMGRGGGGIRDVDEDDSPIGMSGRGRGGFGGSAPNPMQYQYDENDPNVEMIWQTDFAVQFVWKQTPPDERTEDPAKTEAAAGDAGAPPANGSEDP
ncbi:MAG: hypothetical protein KF861_24570, partial [Planctomycetaceae bacterium]|nr:hypothetical protein [Planctomycetaceae bacterium]